MTWEERVGAVVNFGFTKRQAGFLVTVMLHGGVCLGRHYCAFARIAYGQKTHDFFGTLLDRGYAFARACGHNKARLYHVQHRPLYAAIGEPHNRYRKPVTLARAVERMMVLDAVLAERKLTWLATEDDKLTYFSLVHPVPRRDLPALAFGEGTRTTVRYFADKLPIGVPSDRHTHVFLYLLTRPTPVDFRAFLERHAELFRALPSWCVRLLVPRHLTEAVALHEAAFREQLAMPLRPGTRDDLRWYFDRRKAGGNGHDERFVRSSRAFRGPRFQTLYRAWVERGDVVIDATVSHVLADAIARRTGALECRVLAHRYLHLFPLVATA